MSLYSYIFTLSIIYALMLLPSVQGFAEEKNNEGSIWTTMLGNTLYKWNITDTDAEIAEYPTDSLLQGQKVIGLYFSASWCGPCKQFTPLLTQFYHDMEKKGKKFEIVWISLDRTADEFVDYYQSMPWTAVAIQNVAKISASLVEKYPMKGIPYLVILDGEDATVYTVDGRTKVMQDKHGLEFPWSPRGLPQLLPKKMRHQVKSLLEGALNSIAPRRMLGYLAMKVQIYGRKMLHSVYHIIRQQIDTWMQQRRQTSS